MCGLSETEALNGGNRSRFPGVGFPLVLMMFMAIFPPLVLGYAKRLQSGHRARFRAEHDVAMCCQVILVGPLVLRFGEPRQHVIDVWQRRVHPELIIWIHPLPVCASGPDSSDARVCRGAHSCACMSAYVQVCTRVRA